MGPETDELNTIKLLIRAYFKIVKRNLIDYVPKTIITLLVNESCDNCEKELVSRLYSDDRINNLLTRNPSMAAK
jgi:dynamin 1-like protein